MKKYFSRIFLLTCGLSLISCENESESVDVVRRSEVMINISPESTFEDFGKEIANSYKSTYLANNYSICVMSYIYDVDGNAVDSLKVTAKSLNQVSWPSLNLQNQNYTVVTIEMLVGHNGVSPYWRVVNSDKISDLVILQGNVDKDDYVHETGILGVSIDNITIPQKDPISIRPHALGALVDIRYVNLEYSNYAAAAFVTKNVPIGYRLNPLLTSSERFLYTKDASQKETWGKRSLEVYTDGKTGASTRDWGDLDDLVTYAAPKPITTVLDASPVESSSPGADDLEKMLNTSIFSHTNKERNQTAYLIDEGNLNWTYFTYSNVDQVKRNTQPEDDDFGSSYNFIRGGFYYSALVFTNNPTRPLTSIISDEREAVKKWCDNQEYSWIDFIEPCTMFGVSPQMVKSRMKAIDASPNLESSDFLYYKGNDVVTSFEYYFSNNKLSQSRIYIDPKKLAKDELITYYNNKYTAVPGSSTDEYTYRTKDNSRIKLVFSNKISVTYTDR